MNKFIVSIILGGVLFLTACSPSSQPSKAPTSAGIPVDLAGTQTALAYPTYLQQMADASATELAGNLQATLTQSAIVQPTATFAPTATSPVSTEAVVNVGSVSLRSGPGTAYDVLAYPARNDKLTILGQTSNCTWLQVKTADGKTGWVVASSLTFSLACNNIAQASVPPLPTAVGKAQPTQSQPGSGGSACTANDQIVITNSTANGLNITLEGPATYTLQLTSGSSTTLDVCPGTYNWTAYGCGGSGSGSGTVHSGSGLDLVCY